MSPETPVYDQVITRLYEARLYGLDVVEGFMRQYGVLFQADTVFYGQPWAEKLYKLWESQEKNV